MAQPYGSPTPSSPAPKAGGKGIGIGIILMLLGVFGGIALLVLGVAYAANQINNTPSLLIPGQGTIPLDSGDYTLYTDALLSPSDVTVSGPNGPVTPQTLLTSETFTRDGTSYHGFATVSAPATGSYVFTVKSDELGLNEGRLLVGKGALGTVGVALLGIFGGIFGGGLLFVIGFIVLIVGIVRRGKAKRGPGPPPYGGPGQPVYGQQQPGYPPQPAPGGYPQPAPTAYPPQGAPAYPQPGPPQPGPPPTSYPQAPQPPQPGPPPGAPGGPPPPA